MKERDEEHNKKVKEMAEEVLAGLKKMTFELPFTMPSLERIIHIIHVMEQVAMPVYSDKYPFKQIALGYCPHIGMMHHSCSPNVALQYRTYKRSTEFIAIKEIKKGDELTYSYLKDLYKTRIQRRELLKSKFMFDCTCADCLTGSDKPEDDPLNQFQCHDEVMKFVNGKYECNTCKETYTTEQMEEVVEIFAKTAASSKVMKHKGCAIADIHDLIESDTGKRLHRLHYALHDAYQVAFYISNRLPYENIMRIFTEPLVNMREEYFKAKGNKTLRKQYLERESYQLLFLNTPKHRRKPKKRIVSVVPPLTAKQEYLY